MKNLQKKLSIILLIFVAVTICDGCKQKLQNQKGLTSFDLSKKITDDDFYLKYDNHTYSWKNLNELG